MQATYESSISCFNGKLLSLTKNIFKNVDCCSRFKEIEKNISRPLVYEAEHDDVFDYFVLKYLWLVSYSLSSIEQYFSFIIYYYIEIKNSVERVG